MHKNFNIILFSGRQNLRIENAIVKPKTKQRKGILGTKINDDKEKMKPHTKTIKTNILGEFDANFLVFYK